MKEKIFIILIILILIINPVSAFFAKSHEYWTIKGFEDVNSPITEMCRDRIELVIGGNFQTDASVLHYFDEEFMSYVGTHVRTGYDTCLDMAGTDVDLQCYCIGLGLHNVQDHFAHSEEGVVTKYLKEYYSPNMIGHMTTEKSFEIKHLELVNSNPIITSGTLSNYDKHICDNLFIEKGGDYKYIELLNEISGIDMRNDVNLFCNGYLGEGFYNTVYNKKISLPWWFWALSIGLMILGFGASIFLFIFGYTNWKYSLIFIYIILGIIGALILISFYTNNTWQWTQAAIMFNPIRVSSDDIVNYDRVVQQATNRFLETGTLPYDDNSGLSYVDINGNQVVGALSEAEKPFQHYIIPLIVLIFISINTFLFYKTFSGKKTKRRK